MLYHIYGSAIVTGDELRRRDKKSEVAEFFRVLDTGKKPKRVLFSTGELTVLNVSRGFTDEGKTAVPFKPVGQGQPMTVTIREVYTGKYPPGGLFGKKQDLLVTSAVKSITTFDAKPRAINFLAGGVSARGRLMRPAATSQGTPIVFYSPALVEGALTLDLSLVFDRFPKPVFDQIGDTFQAAAGVPIFISYSVYLLAAGAIAKILGTAGEAVFDGKPVFETSDPLNINWPGEEKLASGFLLVTDGDLDYLDKDFRTNYEVRASGQVTDAQGKPYIGDIPYVVISVDGTPHQELSSFTATAASSAILSRFLGMKDGQAQPLGSLLEAVKLLNDFTFRQRVDQMDKQIEAMKDGEEKEALKKQREALAKNILTDLFKK
ncbi:MAG: hypothetical protein HY673_20075 [Chloroflexi bacterium]|nr:hypothetical protein [Chloroflexota bacterium]